jgi:hypothetical protein
VDSPFRESKPKPNPHSVFLSFGLCPAVDCSGSQNQNLRDNVRRHHLDLYRWARRILLLSPQRERIEDGEQEIPGCARNEGMVAERVHLDGRDGGGGADLDGGCVNGEAVRMETSRAELPQQEAPRDGNHYGDQNHRPQGKALSINCEVGGARQVSKEKENAADRMNAENAVHQKDVPNRGKQKVEVKITAASRAGGRAGESRRQFKPSKGTMTHFR